MTKLDGTAEHKHSIYDFTMVGNLTKDSVTNSTTYNGTSTVTMKDGPVTDVSTQITTFDSSAITISLRIPKQQITTLEPNRYLEPSILFV